MPVTFKKVQQFEGVLELAGDKSISHRAVIRASLAGGISTLRNLSEGEDVLATRQIFQALGVAFESDGTQLVVHGMGKGKLRAPSMELDAMNSGTTARLMAGILSAQQFSSIITGDSSLSRRPMRRIKEPLAMMGADIRLSGSGTLPMEIHPVPALRPISYNLPVASAQVKSAVLLAGMFLDGSTEVIEPHPTRDHTELMFGLETRVIQGKRHIYSSSLNYPEAIEFTVPGDISTAAFYVVPALIAENSRLQILNVGLNPTRTGFLNILMQMGAAVEIMNTRIAGGEPVGDLFISSSGLTNVEIPVSAVPNIIDEIPILAVAGLFAGGTFNLRGAEELRMKESDRISALCANLRAAGIEVHEYQDGFSFEGGIGRNLGTAPLYASFGDHRIGMAFAILSMLSRNGGAVDDLRCVDISNPKFMRHIQSIAKGTEWRASN